MAERRVCSVLFGDVVGFTPLSESRDPQAVRELLSRYFAVARTVIGRYGGVVEKFIGDAVMAAGAHRSREGDPSAPSAPRWSWCRGGRAGRRGRRAGLPAGRRGDRRGGGHLGAPGEGMVAGTR